MILESHYYYYFNFTMIATIWAQTSITKIKINGKTVAMNRKIYKSRNPSVNSESTHQKPFNVFPTEHMSGAFDT